MRAFQEGLHALLRSEALAAGALAIVMREVARLAADLCEANAVSVWQLTGDGADVHLAERYDAAARTFAGESKSRYPLQLGSGANYLTLLQCTRVLCVANAAADPRLNGMRTVWSGHPGTADLSAFLDAPVYVRGRIVGFVRIEFRSAAHDFKPAEELAAGSLADCLASAVHARRHARVEAELLKLRTRSADLRADQSSEVARENADLQREVDSLTLTAEAMGRSEEDLRRVFAAAPVPMLILRAADLRVSLANDRAAAALDTRSENLEGEAAGRLFSETSALPALLAATSNSREEGREYRLRTLRGEAFWALVSVGRIQFRGEQCVLIGFSDLTAQKAVEHQLRFLAERDPLTQAYNRHHFWHLARTEMARVRRYARPFSLAMVDADHFKRINDAHGHDVGDVVLRFLVDTCLECLRKQDVLARYGGEEFVVMLPETELVGAHTVMERVRERIAQRPLGLENGLEIMATVSIGISTLATLEEDFEVLLRRADAALYAAKHAGRNRVEVG